MFCYHNKEVSLPAWACDPRNSHGDVLLLIMQTLRPQTRGLNSPLPQYQPNLWPVWHVDHCDDFLDALPLR